METLRDFTNKPGVTFDPDKTYILYAEDLAQIKENFLLLNQFLSLSRQYTDYWLGAIKQGDLPGDVLDAPIPLELRGADILLGTNALPGGDVDLVPGQNLNTSEFGRVTLGGSAGSRGFSVSSAMSGHCYFPETTGEVGDVITMGEGTLMEFRKISSLPDLITLSRNFTQNLISYVSGSYYDLVRFCNATTTRISAANRMEAVPFYSSGNFEIDLIGIAVTTAVASSKCKIAIYNSDENGLPLDLQFGGSDISTSVTGFVSESTSISLVSGKLYWFVLKTSHAITLRVNPVSSAYNLGLSGSNATTYFTVLRKTETYSNSWESSNPFDTSHLVANITPNSIRFRVL